MPVARPWAAITPPVAGFAGPAGQALCRFRDGGDTGAVRPASVGLVSTESPWREVEAEAVAPGCSQPEAWALCRLGASRGGPRKGGGQSGIKTLPSLGNRVLARA